MAGKFLQATLCLFCLLSSTVQAQQGHLLDLIDNGATFGLKTTTVSTQVSSNSGSFVLSPLADGSTYDRINNRFFIASAAYIYMIDAINGTLLDSVQRPPDMVNMEYDEICNCLVGGSISSVGIFTRVNLTTQSVTTYPFSSAGSMQSGESSFDRINRHYFFRTTNQVRVVDSVGAIVLTLNNYRGLEYDATLNATIGIFLTLPPVLTRTDLNTMTAVNICTLPVAFQNFNTSATTYDETNHRYFIKYQQSVLCIDAVTGASTSIASSVNAGLEYANLPNQGSTIGLSSNTNSQPDISVFPNPGNGVFQFHHVHPNQDIVVTDVLGKIVLTKKTNSTKEFIDLRNLEGNLFFYKLFDKNGFLTSGTLVKYN